MMLIGSRLWLGEEGVPDFFIILVSRRGYYSHLVIIRR
jgi:hypothetical protein